MKLLFLLLLPLAVFAQKKTMTPDIYTDWNKIENSQISNDGDWISYRLTTEGGRSDLYIYNSSSKDEFLFPNASKAKFDFKSKFCAFLCSTHPDSIKAMKLQKMATDDLPNDTLCILDLATKSFDKIPNVTSFKLPEDYSGLIAYKLDAAKDTLNAKSKRKKRKKKKEAKATELVVLNMNSDTAISFSKVLKYIWSKENGHLAIYNETDDSLSIKKIDLFESSINKISTILKPSGACEHLSFDKTGNYLAFITDRDTTDKDIKPFELFVWNNSKKSIKKVDTDFSELMLSQNRKPYFLTNQKKLIFGVAPIPGLPDSTILDEDKVEVEVWHYQDQLLHTQQNVNKEKDLKKNFLCSYDLESTNATSINQISDSEININKRLKRDLVLSYNNKEYQKYITWLGHDFKDLYLTNINTGEKKRIANKIDGFPRLSPTEDFVYWYSRIDTAWVSYNIKKEKTKKITQHGFYDELNDRPMDPYPNGIASWLDDNSILIYDQFDIWKIDAFGKNKAINLTDGRDQQVKYRYIRLDKEKNILPKDTTILIHHFSEKDKSSGYAYLNLGTQVISILSKEDLRYTTRVIKAKNANDVIYTKESFDLFPDLIHSDLSFAKTAKISAANPQQKDFAWGTIEAYYWNDHLGQQREGLLVKPDNFDPNKKYPLIVNFYEKSSDRLHRHQAPYAGRSTINYSYYANKGYLIFNPDIHYYDGYPGESCYLAIMEAVDQLVSKGYVDETRMGLQGHSWGGYQIAHLLTKTNRFKCAESGAPVVNMISAYGGIRWGSGMSRMFQYEKTQSRIGATLWERPDLYIANSPIFNLDKVETPVLILHNDNDGAVPWYQGIEYFVGLRRLGKPAWLLNYNDEPHWPVKKQNRIDFNIRLEQFFDHYLMDKKMPVWMKIGIPAVEEGLNDGLEIYKDK